MPNNILKHNPKRTVRNIDNDVRVMKDIISTPEVVGNRQFKFVISTSDVDTSNDVIDQSGWKLDHFKRNPVVLFNHLDQILPIGKCVWIGVEDNKLKAIVEFATAEQNPQADQVYRLVQGGFMNATSVGFSPIEMSETTEAERGADTFEAGIDFKRCELYEFSIVNLPANPYCLIEPGQRTQDTTVLETAKSSNKSPILNKSQRELRKLHLDMRARINKDI